MPKHCAPPKIPFNISQMNENYLLYSHNRSTNGKIQENIYARWRKNVSNKKEKDCAQSMVPLFFHSFVAHWMFGSAFVFISWLLSSVKCMLFSFALHLLDDGVRPKLSFGCMFFLPSNNDNNNNSNHGSSCIKDCAQLQPQLNPLNVNEHSLCVFLTYPRI